ncbi:acyl-CoA thioesterase [Sphaerisporangium dianthi]|uniref:Acyl-CoA thioesterase n=1 Tax=Sphaerisporangium dianthi TaxID=1436120 RepID=A0ABV9CRM1_9ACTN
MKNQAIHDLINEATLRPWLQPMPVTPVSHVSPERSASGKSTTGRHVFHRPVRFADIDAHGHVNNVRFLDYLEDARIALFFDFLRKTRNDAHPETSMVSVAVARHQVDYRRPLLFRHGVVQVESWVTKIGQVRFELAAEIRNEEEVFAEARSLIVAYDPETAGLRRFTAEEHAFLRRYVA